MPTTVATHRIGMRDIGRVLAATATAAFVSGFLWGCSNVELEPAEGSTLPVPDMTKVEFTTGAVATNEIVVTGDVGAAEPLSDLFAENENTGTVDATETTEAGSFVLRLSDAEVGHRVKISVEQGKEFSDHAILELAVHGTPPPAPIELFAKVSLDSDQRAAVSGWFQTTEEVTARIANERTGQVTHVATVLEAEHRTFELLVDAIAGDLLVIYGLSPVDGTTPGPYATVEVQPL